MYDSLGFASPGPGAFDAFGSRSPNGQSIFGMNPMFGLTGGGFMDPRTQGLLGAAASLLAASGPSTTPKNFGQIAGQGFMGGTQAFQQARQGQMQELQGALLTAKLQREIEGQDKWNSLFPTPSAGAQPGAPSGNPMIPGPNSSVMAGSGSEIPAGQPPMVAPGATMPTGPSLQQIGALGGPDPERAKFALEWWKANNPDVKWEGGVPLNSRTGQPLAGAPILPQTNQQGFSTRLQFDPASQTFRLGLTPGGTEAFRTQADISEAAKASRDPFLGVVDTQGRPVPMTRETFANRYGGTGSPVPAPSAHAAAPVAPAAPGGAAPTGGGMGPTGAQRKFSEGSADNAVKYRAGLNERVNTGQDLMLRIGESENLLKDFQAGGGEGVRVKLAQMAQAVGAPQVLVDKITRGDLGSAQAFQKIVVSQAMEALKQAMSTSAGTGAGRITQAEFKIFQESNPNLELDPRALEKIYGFAKKVHARDYSEQQAFQKWIDGGQDPASFQVDWASKMAKQLKTTDLKAITASTGQAAAGPKPLRYNTSTGRIE